MILTDQITNVMTIIELLFPVLNSPTITALTPTSTTLLIEWASPASDYIESYQILYRGGNAESTTTHTVDGTTREFLLTDLTPGETYAVNVVAVSGTQSVGSAGMTTTTCEYLKRIKLYIVIF